MEPSPDRRDSFKVLLRDSLRIQSGEDLLLVYDETLTPFWPELFQAILEGGYSCTFAFLPIEYQRRLAAANGNGELPSGLSTAIYEVDVVVTILSGDVNLAGVRRTIVGRATGPRLVGGRLAHIPGLSAAILDALLVSPIQDIEQSCETMAWAFGEASRAVLTTEDHQGRSHTLRLNLGGWSNEPLMSPGVIYRGSWGNVPPGETFCCPAHEDVEGSIVINGSIPGLACEPHEDIVLTFANGRLTDWHSASPALREFFDKQRAHGDERADHNWNVFAELGIGLNPKIQRLTGNPLFDEKAHGTIHIAIGDNSGFGHDVRSQIHADLVTRNASIEVDGGFIVRNGVICADDIEKRRRDLVLPPVDCATVANIDKFHERFEMEPQWTGAFCRRLHSRGRTGYVRIASGPVAAQMRLLAAIRAEDWTSPAQLRASAERSGLSNLQLSELLAILNHYQMIRIEQNQGR
jgi:hypothetical protein